MYYTLGQRRGWASGGAGNGQRWFVVDKDLEHNVLYVEQGADSPALYSASCRTEPFHFISPPAQREFDCTCRYRYRQPDQQVRVFFAGKRRGGDRVYRAAARRHSRPVRRAVQGRAVPGRRSGAGSPKIKSMLC